MTDKKDRTEQILAVLLINSLKGATVADKVKQLNLAGFSNIEVADLLETTTNHVAQALFKAKKKPKSKKVK